MAFTNQAGVYLGPLTTSWSMPASCSLHFSPCSTCQEGFRGQACASGAPQDHAGCWPPTIEGVATRNPPYVGWGFYSPGLACPTGYTSACTAIHGEFPEWNIQFTLRPGETAIGCCPTGYQCTNRNGNTCIAIASTSTDVPSATCDGADVVQTTLKPFPDIVTVTRTTTDAEESTSAVVTGTLTRTMTLLAPMFQLNFQSTDVVATSSASSDSPAPTAESQSPSSPAPSSSLSSETLSSAAAEGTSDSGEVERESDGPSLSGGAWAGVAVGAMAGLLLLVALVGWFFIKRKRRTRRKGQMWLEQEDKAASGAEAPPDGRAMQHAVYEVEGAGGRGYPSDGYSKGKGPMELPPNPPVELPGDSWR